MKKFFHSLVFAILATACLDKPVTLALRRGDGSGRDADGNGISDTVAAVTPGGEDSLSLEVPSSIFVCGVQWPDSSAERLVLYKDSTRLLEFATGAATGSSSEADTHFLFHDSLYTSITVRGSTIVARNGEVLFTYDAREYMVGMLPDAGHLWTLGNDRSGEGFSLRRDGIQTFSGGKGSAGGLYKDGGHIYFSYGVTLADSRLLYLVEDGVANGISPLHGSKVLDAAVCGGSLWLLEDSASEWILSGGGNRWTYSHVAGMQLGSGRLYRKDDGTCAAVVSLIAPAVGNMPVDLVCEGESCFLRGGGSGTYHYFTGQGGAHVTYTRDMSRLGVLHRGVESELDSTAVATERCCRLFGDRLVMACSSLGGCGPFVRDDGKAGGEPVIHELDFEGYPTGVDISPPN